MNASGVLREDPKIQAVAYAVGLCGTCALLWIGYAAVTVEPAGRLGRGGGASLVHAAVSLWFMPMPYLLAWSILAVRSLREAGAILVTVGVVNLALAGLATGFGVLTGGILALPAIVGAAWCSGALLATLHHPGSAAEGSTERWRRIHRGGSLAAGLGLAATALMAVSAGAPWAASTYVILGSTLVLSLAPHAVMSWRQLRADRVGHSILPRAAALIAFSYGVPAGLLSGLGQVSAGATWPVEFLAARDRQHAALGERIGRYGVERGRVLAPGERATLRIGGEVVTATAPEGWRIWIDEPPTGAEAQPGWFLLRRDDGGAARAPALAIRIEVGRPWAELRVVPSPGSATEDGRPRRWPDLCEPVRADGLILCRSVQGRRALEAETARTQVGGQVPGSRAVLVDFLPHGPEGGFVKAIGRGFRAGCIETANCVAQFSMGEGAMAAATFPARHLGRWRDLRAEVDAVMRAAIGRGLEEGPAVLQPEREVLILGSD